MLLNINNYSSFAATLAAFYFAIVLIVVFASKKRPFVKLVIDSKIFYSKAAAKKYYEIQLNRKRFNLMVSVYWDHTNYVRVYCKDYFGEQKS